MQMKSMSNQGQKVYVCTDRHGSLIAILSYFWKNAEWQKNTNSKSWTIPLFNIEH